MTDFQREREALGHWLSQLRRDASLNGKELASQLGWPGSKVSRIELGKQTASKADVLAWAEAVGKPEAAGELTARVTALETHYVSHRRMLAKGHTGLQRAWAAQEEATTYLRVFEVAIVPGLLQTADYARHVFSAMAALKNLPDDTGTAIAARLERQRVLYDPRKRFHFVITSGALRARTCPAEVMRGQLDRLIVATTMERVRLGIIPDHAQLIVPPMHGFWILDDRLVQAEVLAADLNLTDESDIRLHIKAFDRLASTAAYGSAARAVLTQIAIDLADVS
ncbi:MAG TPA: helix-turn-helix transcriptional regulator [Streptosporangiaceae bacterium]|nr:helix-turn-helix transcriptional regulator [Streptosporangiaceae bacterium]